MNGCHDGACVGNMSGYVTVQNILRDGYFWLTLFRDCILAVHKCHACQIYNKKSHAPLAPMHPVLIVGPFSKWGIQFMTCNPRSVGRHGYIIVFVDYFTKWVELMPAYNNTRKTIALFLFNHVIAIFGVP